MNISAPFIARPVATALLAIAMLLAGMALAAGILYLRRGKGAATTAAPA